MHEACLFRIIVVPFLSLQKSLFPLVPLLIWYDEGFLSNSHVEKEFSNHIYSSAFGFAYNNGGLGV
jgi:hypothetical protein